MSFFAVEKQLSGISFSSVESKSPDKNLFLSGNVEIQTGSFLSMEKQELRR
jgi:hypothetical protein